MIPKLFDVHTHVQFHAFKNDADFVIQRARDAGVWMVNVGTQKNTSEKAVEIAQKYTEGIYAAVGLHPIHTEKSYHDEQELGLSAEALLARRSLGVAGAKAEIANKELGGFESREEEFDYEYYRKLAVHPKVVAVGECGLDYYRLGFETKERQRGIFLQQIGLAHEVKKPLMIHCRKAFSDLISLLQATSYKLHTIPGIIHFFSGTKDDAAKLLDLGFSFSFGGVITFSRDYDEVVKYIPLGRAVLETDAPYVTPVPHRGKRNEPFYVSEVAKKLAELKGLAAGEVAEVTTKNALTLFGINP